MKKIVFLFCLFFTLSVNAQESNNTIVNDNSAWATLNSWLGFTDSVILFRSTCYHFFDGDSIFNKKTYKKVFYYKDEQHTERFFAGLIREDNLKTYYVPYHLGLETLLEERVLYNFSLEQGDTFEYPIGSSETETLYVLQSDFVLINNEQKKRLIIAPENNINWVIDTIIENVGSLYGLLYPLCYMCDGVFHELLCYTENGELLYKNPKYSECYYNNLSVQEAKKSSNISVFPNPTNGKLQITNYVSQVKNIVIFDVIGKLQKVESRKQSEEIEIDISNFSNGLYMLKIFDITKGVSIFKIVKN